MRTTLGLQHHPPVWLNHLITHVTCAIVDHDCHAPVGCHFYQNPGTAEWEISAFVSSTEVVGGPMDGTEVNPPVQLDISSVIDEASALIAAIDTQTPQVMIEAKIVEANLNFSRELGSSWSLTSQPLVDPFTGAVERDDLGSSDFRFHGNNGVSFSNPITSTPTALMDMGAFLLDDKLDINVGFSHVFQPTVVVTEGILIQRGITEPGTPLVGNIINNGRYDVSYNLFGASFEGHF